MARYSQDHKDATRRRIVGTSARRLKADGVDGSGVATLMADAGLTNGAFYAHFASKDALVAEVVREQLAVQQAEAEALSGADEVVALIRAYLSTTHRDHPGEGCPSAALLDEIARSGEQVRTAYTEGLEAYARALVAALGRRASRPARATVLATLAGMAGTLQMARAVTDPALSRALLDQGVRNALTALEVAPS